MITLINLAVMFRTNDPNLGHVSVLEAMKTADLGYMYGLWRGIPKSHKQRRKLMSEAIADTLELLANKAAPVAIPPDPEDLNDHRAEWAALGILAFQAKTRIDHCDVLADLLADLGHWADRNGQSFTNELRRAMSHYGEETASEGKQFSNITIL